MAFNYSTSMFIGTTSRGIDMPVFFDTHTPIFNNNTPGILITGQPGTGKTFLAMTLTSICAIIGKTTIVLDPKGDFVPLINLKKDIGKVNFWNLSDRKKKGTLDPFYMADDPGDKLDLVVTVIDMFVGGLKDEQYTVLSPIVKDVLESPNPSLLAVKEQLSRSDKSIARDLGTRLDLISRLPYAELCFSPGNKKATLDINEGTTIVTMVGLELTPPDNSTAGSQVNANKSRLASTIFYLITDFIRRIMNNDQSTTPKTLIIDEAWAILATPAGASCIKAVARLGRSRKLAMVLVTQNNSDLEKLDIANTISTRFAFRTDPKEAEGIVKGMLLPEEEGFEQTLIDLGNGECLMKDFHNRYSTVQISDYKKDWVEMFETNPLKKDRIKKRKAKAAIQNKS